MNKVSYEKLNEFVNDNISLFHDSKLRILEKLTLKKLLTKNPYLFKAKNIQSASEMITGLLDAFLSSSEEKVFGDFLENLAIFIAGQTIGGHKSSAQGIDLEFEHENSHYLVSIKSGVNWGNSSQHAKLKQDFDTALRRIKQSHVAFTPIPVLGICYGKRKKSYKNGFYTIVGQEFWHLISGNENLYIDIIEPIGYNAKVHNERFQVGRAILENRMNREFLDDFCRVDGSIDWEKLVKFNSGNM